MRLVLAGIALLSVFAGVHLQLAHRENQRLEAIVSEISAIGEFRDAPLCNHAGSRLAFLRNTDEALALHFMDLPNGQPRRVLEIQYDYFRHFKTFGWSPDDRWFVVAQNPDRLVEETFLLFLDGTDGSPVLKHTEIGAVANLLWHRTNAFVYVGPGNRLHEGSLESMGDSANQPVFKTTPIATLPRGSDMDSLLAMSDKELAFFAVGALTKLDLETREFSEIGELGFERIDWLDYSPETGQFLFCAKDRKAKGWPQRLLHRFDPDAAKGKRVTALTAANTFKGQWVLGGGSYSYIGSVGNNVNPLFVEQQGAPRTPELFNDGFIRAYSVSPDRKRIHAFASSSTEPHGIWEYDLPTGRLTQILAPTNAPFHRAKIIRPLARSLQISGRKNLPYTLIPPRGLRLEQKYSAVIDGPNSARWRPEPQAIANAGIYYIAANRWGLASSDDFSNAAEDIEALFHELAGHPNIDPKRIFIMGHSYGTRITSEVVSSRDLPWAGVILHSPVAFPKLPDEGPRRSRLLVTIGTEDSYHKRALEFEIEACARLMPLRMLTFPDTGHSIRDTDTVRTRALATVRFILGRSVSQSLVADAQ